MKGAPRESAPFGVFIVERPLSTESFGARASDDNLWRAVLAELRGLVSRVAAPHGAN